MELQGEIDRSTIIAGDFNTPLSVVDREKRNPRGSQSCGKLEMCSIHYGMVEECTKKDILPVLWGVDYQEDLGRVFELDCQLHKGSE